MNGPVWLVNGGIWQPEPAKEGPARTEPAGEVPVIIRFIIITQFTTFILNRLTIKRMFQIRIFRVILVCAALLINSVLSAQSRFEVSTGAGLFDGVFLKARYGQKFQVGLSQDLISQMHTTGLEFFYRLPRRGAPGTAGPFYVMCGISTTLFGKGYDTFEQSYLYPRIGRSFLFPGRSSRVGVNAELGVTVHRTTNPPEGYITELFPFSVSAGFFYRF